MARRSGGGGVGFWLIAIIAIGFYACGRSERKNDEPKIETPAAPSTDKKDIIVPDYKPLPTNKQTII